MIGITSYGAYVPLRRLGPETEGWGFPFEKAVGYYDEDSLTMAVAASLDCLGRSDRTRIDGFYFASATAPYKEKLTATTAAIACDLRDDILTVDFSNSLRAGTAAIRTALDTVKAGSAGNLLVTAADCGRLGQARDTFDQNAADGAAAFVVGDKDVIATIEGAYSISNEMLDIWRIDGGKYVRAWEDRFVMDEGYFRILPMAISSCMKKQNLELKEITKVIFYAPDRRRHAEMAKRLGLAPAQIQDALFGRMGNTGTAFCPMLLVAALEESKPGDTILLANYGNGADILYLKVTENISKIKNHRGVRRNLDTKMIIPDYDNYLAYRHRPPDGSYYPPVRPSASAILRERDFIFRLHGGRCKNCASIQYPPQRICSRCKAKDSMEPVRLSDRKAKVFTFTLDNLAQIPAYDLPMVDTIINFAGGGRGCFQMTDRDPRRVKIDMEVEMTFRKLHTSNEMNNYFWKCMPVREASPTKEPK
jgi:hydroxymethylglutaryl-CoA synthase